MSNGAGSRRSDRNRGVPHREAAPDRVDGGPTSVPILAQATDTQRHAFQLLGAAIPLTLQ